MFLGKQYTLTHVALQSIGGGVDVSELKVQYEKTEDGTKWTNYSKEIDGKEIPKVCLLLFLQGFQKKIGYLLLQTIRPPTICHGDTGHRRSTTGHKTSCGCLLSLPEGSPVSVSPKKLLFSPSCQRSSIFFLFFHFLVSRMRWRLSFSLNVNTWGALKLLQDWFSFALPFCYLSGN